MRTKIALVLVLATSRAGFGLYHGLAARQSPVNVDALLGEQIRPSMEIGIFAPGKSLTATFDIKLAANSGFLYQEMLSTGERVDTYRRQNKTLSARLKYYPLQEGQETPTLQTGVAYAVDGETLIGDASYSAAGIRTSSGSLQPDDMYRVRGFFADGVNIEREAWYAPNPFGDHERKLAREDIHREDKSLFSQNLANDDGTHTITWYDRQKQTLKVKHEGIRPVISSIVAYWPGTQKIRMQSKSDYTGTEAEFFDEQGLRTSTMNITTYSVVVQYYGKDGQTVKFDQTWSISRTPGAKPSFDLQHVSERDRDGNATRELTFDGGKLKEDNRTGVTIGGIEYTSVTMKYNSDGTFESVDLHPRAGEPAKSATAALALHSRIPPRELEADLSEDLPLPPLPTESAGHH